ncbi:N-acyl homoserine lactonase family protein [Streptomyces sp. SID2131]|nr:N-acyl homoserine lactonase family protein [Streptomyces sp. SID2131]
MTSITVHRLDLGHFTRPAEEWGGPHARVEPVFGYLVRHARGALLLDTGMGTGSPETDAHYRPVRSLLPGVRYEELDGEHEIAPGVLVVPTPGHTEGHRSLFLDHGDRVTVLAGQAYDFAAGFGTPYRPWLGRLAELAAGRPARVLFAHDHAVREGVLPPPR